MVPDPILDPNAIQALRDLSPEGDGEFLRELISIFLADTPKQMANIESALAAHDGALLVRAAHTIKGSAGNFGAGELAQLAGRIEQSGKAGDFAAVRAILPDFKTHYGLVAEALRQLAAH
jgi:HPt (histidine-containing phosphotransfer) domain-containing protein